MFFVPSNSNWGCLSYIPETDMGDKYEYTYEYFKNVNKALIKYIFFLVSRCTFGTSHLLQLFGMELGRARELVAEKQPCPI